MNRIRWKPAITTSFIVAVALIGGLFVLQVGNALGIVDTFRVVAEPHE